MAVGIQIQDKDSGNKVTVTKRGQVVISPLDFSAPVSIFMEDVDTPYTLIKPRTGKKYVITDIIVSTTFQVGINGATVQIYEANELDGNTSIMDIVNLNINKQVSLPILTLNWVIDAGSFIVAQTDDDDVYITLAGYYIDA